VKNGRAGRTKTVERSGRGKRKKIVSPTAPTVRKRICRPYLDNSDKMGCRSLSPVFKSELGSPGTIVHVHGFISFVGCACYQKMINVKEKEWRKGRFGSGGVSREDA
jgi:hypothetical protein